MRVKKQNISVRVLDKVFDYLVKRSEKENRSLSSLCDELLNKQINLEKAQENTNGS